jgi:hypothetical protein
VWNKDAGDLKAVAARRDLNPDVLQRWTTLTATNAPAVTKIDLLTGKMNSISGNNQLLGWGSDATPWLGVNSRDEPANAGFIVPPRSLAMHPSPDRKIAIGWQSPLTGRVRVGLRVSDGHPGGGNGVDWEIAHRGAIDERILQEGHVKQGGSFPDGDSPTAIGEVDVSQGEFISLVIAAHDHQHACDTTICDLTITEIEGQSRTWQAAEQLYNRIHLSNPLTDTSENRSVWHFYTVNDTTSPSAAPVVARSSLLGKWIDLLHTTNDSKELVTHAAAVQQLFLQEPNPASAKDINQSLRDSFNSPAGPLFAGMNLTVSHDEKAKTEIAARQAELNPLRPIAAQPLPPLPLDSEIRRRKSLQQVVWALLMSSEFRFNH